MRINRILSLSGICSRRKADEWILQGRVKLNEQVVRSPGVRAFWGKDRIKVDDREIPGPSSRVYLMLNKPFGYICSLKDPEGRPVVTDLLQGVEKRIYPVGRLDFDSLGLLLLTDDGEFAHRLTHPRYRVPRTYKVTVEGQISDRALESLEKGLYLEDGFSGRAKVTLLQRDHRQSVVRMTVTAGKNRLIRRMLGKVGHRVIHLLRIGFGPLELGDLK
ncbi:MAG: rRNA pseudouridine synthase, partial [Deltaproteobacteria bacterium]|nr:rRNA pseudouridine synthase [Deltaproteobacteria bacterium]